MSSSPPQMVSQNKPSVLTCMSNTPGWPKMILNFWSFLPSPLKCWDKRCVNKLHLYSAGNQTQGFEHGKLAFCWQLYPPSLLPCFSVIFLDHWKTEFKISPQSSKDTSRFLALEICFKACSCLWRECTLGGLFSIYYLWISLLSCRDIYSSEESVSCCK